MIAIRQEERPAVGLVPLEADAVRQWSCTGAICVYAPDETARVRRIDDDSSTSPASSSSSKNIGEDLGRAACNRHSLQFSISEERHVGAVRRQKWIACAFRSRQRC